MILEELLSLPNTFIYGSRALEVNSEKSDYDIVMLYSSILNFLLERLNCGGDFSIERYFNLSPKGKGYFFRYVGISDIVQNVQVLVLTENEDLQIFKKALIDLKELPKFAIESKQDRIRLFENRLLFYGWTKPYINNMLDEIAY